MSAAPASHRAASTTGTVNSKNHSYALERGVLRLLLMSTAGCNDIDSYGLALWHGLLVATSMYLPGWAFRVSVMHLRRVTGQPHCKVLCTTILFPSFFINHNLSYRHTSNKTLAAGIHQAAES
jgi:hypothetical protein